MKNGLVQRIATCLGFNWKFDLSDSLKDKRDMNAESVVSILTGENVDSDWNNSEEEQEDYFEEDSVRLDRFEMELGKMADTRGSFYMLDFAIDGGEESEKDNGNDDGEDDSE